MRARIVAAAVALSVLAAVGLAVQLPAAEAAETGSLSDLRPGYCGPGSVSSELERDCRRLLHAKHRLDQDGVLNWDWKVEVKHWTGVEVNEERTAVTGLNLRDMGLTGSIPPELGQLTGLQRVDLTHNDLTGPIPGRLGQLANLKGLRLSNNRLSGEIPAELGNLKSLKELGLGRNHLQGKIPNELANLVNLERFVMRDNRLSGEIPFWLENIEGLRFVWLTNNRFTGTLPPNLGASDTLQYLRVQNNRLTGAIPDSYGNREWRCLLLRGNDLTDTCLPRSLKGKVKTQDMRACSR